MSDDRERSLHILTQGVVAAAIRWRLAPVSELLDASRSLVRAVDAFESVDAMYDPTIAHVTDDD